MANLRNLPPMGTEGVPAPKRPRLESTNSETSEVLAKIFDFNDLPDELMNSSNFFPSDLDPTALSEVTAQPQSLPQQQSLPTQGAVKPAPPSYAAQQGNPGGNSNSTGGAPPGSNPAHPQSVSTSANAYTNSNPGYASLTSSAATASPKPNASISTSGDPTPTLPSVSSSSVHPTSSLAELAPSSFPSSAASAPAPSLPRNVSSMHGPLPAGIVPNSAQALRAVAPLHGVTAGYGQRMPMNYSQAGAMQQHRVAQPGGPMAIAHQPHPHQGGVVPGMQSRMVGMGPHHMAPRSVMHPGMSMHGMAGQQPMPGGMRLAPHMSQPGYPGGPPMHRGMAPGGAMMNRGMMANMTGQHVGPQMIAHGAPPHPAMQAMPGMTPGMRPATTAMAHGAHTIGPTRNLNPAPYQDGLSSLEPSLRPLQADFPLAQLSPQQQPMQRLGPGQPGTVPGQTPPHSQQSTPLGPSPVAGGMTPGGGQTQPQQTNAIGDIGAFGATPPRPPSSSSPAAPPSSSSPALSSLSMEAGAGQGQSVGQAPLPGQQQQQQQQLPPGGSAGASPLPGVGAVSASPSQQPSGQQQQLTAFSQAPATPSGQQQQPSPGTPQSSQQGVPSPGVVGAASLMGLPTSPGQNPQVPGQGGQASDPEKRKLIQQQLVLLLHAHKCQRREREQQGNGDYRACNLPHCRTMKNVLNHMTECQAGRSCTYHHCASSRQIITHWKNCQRHDCPVCLPLKSASLAHKRDPLVSNSGGLGGPWGPSSMPGKIGGQQSNMQLMMPPGQPQAQMQPGPSGPPSYMDQSMNFGGPNLNMQNRMFGPTQGMPGDMAQPPRVPYSVPIPTIQQGPPSMVLAWHQDVNLDLRQHLVRKLVEAIYPVQDPAALQDRRVASLVTYAMKVEKAMFETAGSREEYYQLLAEKIYRIRKELEERRKLKQSTSSQSNMMNGEPILQKPNDFYRQNNTVGMGHMPPMQQQQPQQGLQQGLQGMPRPIARVGVPATQGGASAAPPSNMDPTSNSFPFPPSTISPKPKLLTSPPALPLSVPPSLSPAKPPLASLGTSRGGSPAAAAKPDIKIEGDRPVDIKTEVKAESGILSPMPGSIKSGVGTPSAWTEPKAEVKRENSIGEIRSLPSIPAVPTPPTHVPVASVKAVSSVPPPSTPAMDTADTASPAPQVAKIVPDLSLRKVFTPDELEKAIRPVFERIWNQDPEAYPFRQPVDPTALGIPDYFEIIQKPMDLAAIRNKLSEGGYTTPWEFCEDMWQMFHNAWAYNKKTSRVYKFCTKLSEVFDLHVDGVMRNLGYCCGGKYTFHPQVLYCFGKPLCTIPRDGPYYGYQTRSQMYVYCPKCFLELPGDTVSVGDDPSAATIIPKANFKELKNNSVDYEPKVDCIHCGRSMHRICVLHHDHIWPEGFQCDGCLKAKSISRKENKFSAKRLPTTKLSQFLEDRCNTFLHCVDSDVSSEVIIRIVSSTEKILDTRTMMRDRFEGEFPDQFPYRSKAMFVFEEIDGVDVCFFGMHVQEYGSDCHAPNTRRVYISYLDSVHFFHPRHLRTQVYHEILIGYLDFCKQHGFETAHIWACPPSEGDDYIFHCHPVEQKIPKPKRLVDWYRKMLDRGLQDKVLYDYRDIFKYATEDGMLNVTEIPYFDGDFWPNVVEETIKELDQEAKEREASEQASVEGRGMKKVGKRNNSKKGSKKAGGARSKSSKKGSLVIGGDSLSTKIYQTMEKHKDVFFVVNLQPPRAPDAALPCTTDPDQLITCDLMDGRDAFLTMARERHWEFSSLRRAKFSSMAMLHELHNQSADRFVYTCNNCRMHVETRYHCRECADFDLCIICYKESGHHHPMDKLGLDLDDEIQTKAENRDPHEVRRASMERCIHYLIHASQCREPHCRLPSCIKMKRILRHTRECKLRMTHSCNICKQFLVLCYTHAKSCTDSKCPVPVCARLKKNIREQQAAQRRRNDRFTYKRMQNMSQLNSSAASSSAAATAASPAPAANSTSPTDSKITAPSPSKGSPAGALPASTPAVSNPVGAVGSPINPVGAVGSPINPVGAVGSPINPRSVGKGGPRTPGEIGNRVTATSTGMQAPGSAPPYNRPEQPIVAPNVIVSQPSMGGMMPSEHKYTQEQRIIMALKSPNPQDQQQALNFMRSNPDVAQKVKYQMKLQQQSSQGHLTREMIPNSMGMAYAGGASQVQTQPNPAMIQRAQQPQMMGYGPAVQPIRPAMQPHPYMGGGHPQYRNPVQHPSQPMMHQAYSGMNPAMSIPTPQQPQPQQQQHPSQLQKILSSRAPIQQYPANAYTQMGHTSHAVGPPPYPSTPVRHGPQTTAYPQMLGQAHPMGQPMAGQMPPPSAQYASHQGMPMDPGMMSDPNFMYSQPQYGLNSSNNNNAMPQDPLGGLGSSSGGLTPQDQLLRYADNL